MFIQGSKRAPQGQALGLTYTHVHKIMVIISVL